MDRSSESPARLRLLLVEDNPGDAELVHEQLLAHEPTTALLHATTLREACEIAKSRVIDGVILDLHLPDSQGLGTLDALRATHAFVPIIVLSGGITAASRIEALRRGATEVIDKNEPRDRFFCSALLYVIERHRADLRQADVSSLVATSPEAMLVLDAREGVTFVNAAALELFGRAEDELIGEALAFSFASASEVTIHRPDGGFVIGEVRVAPMRWRGEEAHLVSIRDVTTRKREDELRQRSEQLELEGRLREEFLRELESANKLLAERNEALARANAVSRALLREVHHRVKNNLQIISSVLQLQAARIANPEVLAVFESTSRRVLSIAKAHEQLHQDRNPDLVDARPYIRSLVEPLASIFGDERRIALRCEIEAIVMPIDVAIACGLVINELVTNAFKHAFPGDRRGHVAVGLARLADGSLELVVSDDGVGGAPSARREHSLGWELVETFAEQLRGELSTHDGGGFGVRLRFAPTL